MSLLRTFVQRKPSADSAAIRRSDQLVESARQMLSEGNAEGALEVLREVRQVTPMRADIRRLAEKAIAIRNARLAASPRDLPERPAPPPTEAEGPGPRATRGLTVPTEPPERSPAKSRTPRSGAPRPPAPPIGARTSRQPRPAASIPQESSAGPRPPASELSGPFLPTDRALLERRLPRLNILAWVAVIGVAGVVMIGSTAILSSGTNTLYKVESKTGGEEGIPAVLAEQLREAKRELSAGEPLRAVARLQLSLDRYPKQEKEISPILAKAYGSHGDSLRREASYERAAEAYDKAAGAATSDPTYRVAQAHCLYMAARTAQDHKDPSKAKGFYKESLAAYEKALTIAPHHGEATLGKAKVYAAQNQRKEAVACYKDVVQSHPNTPESAEAQRMLRTLTGDR